MHPNQKSKNVLLFILIFLIIGIVTTNPLFYAASAILSIFFIFDLLSFLIALNGMEVSINKKTSKNKMFINNILEINNELVIKVKNLKNISFQDEIPDVFIIISGDPVYKIDTEKPLHNFTFELKAIKKGNFEFEKSYLNIKSNFQMFEHRETIENRANVSIYPRVLSRQALITQYVSSRYRHKTGIGNEFKDLRDYMFGDDFRHIDWKTSLRLNRLFVKEFELDTEMPHFILVDQSKTTYSDTGFDYTIRVASYLTQIAANSNQQVGMVTYKQDCVTNQVLIKNRNKQYKLLKKLISLEPLESIKCTSSMDIMEIKGIERKLKSCNSEKFYSILQPFFAGNPEHLKLIEKQGVYQAIKKVIAFSKTPSVITIISDLNDDVPLIESVRLATYYGNRVFLIVTSCVLFRGYDVLEFEEHYKEYLEFQKKINKFRRLKNVHILDVGPGDKAELLLNKVGYRWTYQ